MLDDILFHIGGRPVTALTVLAPLAVLAASLTAAAGVGMVFRRLRDRASPPRRSLIYVSGQVLRYVLIFAGIFMAISAAGLNLSSLSIFAGALGVGIGLGLQDIVRNFVCGIILMFDRSIEIGDFIELDPGSTGQVVSIGPRATTLKTNDHVDIVVPNATLLNATLINWTRDRATRRVHIQFGVAYGSDKDLVKRAAVEAADAVPFTEADDGQRRTQVWLVGFGDSAMNFELVVWPSLEAVKRPGNMMAAYRWALDDALKRHGVEIPYPQTDVRVRSLFGSEGADALQAWAGRASGEQPPPAARPAPSAGEGPAPSSGRPDGTRNDAVRDIEAQT